MEKDIRIVYMGTPDFAVAPLERLVNEGYNVVGVVTMPDKAVGRHHDVLQASPVKQWATEHSLPVLQPEKLRDKAFLAQLASLQADLQVVVAFRMLPEVVWAMPRLGTFNLHAALLPQYRGAAPINWAIINGERETGVTTFFLDHDIDTGRILLQERCPIYETDTAEDVHDRLMTLGTDVVLRTIDLIASGEARAVPQEQFITDAPLRHAPKIFRETCEIRWAELGAKQTYDFIRGLSLDHARLARRSRTDDEGLSHGIPPRSTGPSRRHPAHRRQEPPHHRPRRRSVGTPGSAGGRQETHGRRRLPEGHSSGRMAGEMKIFCQNIWRFGKKVLSLHSIKRVFTH